MTEVIGGPPDPPRCTSTYDDHVSTPAVEATVGPRELPRPRAPLLIRLIVII
jgi:hypothetical protein